MSLSQRSQSGESFDSSVELNSLADTDSTLSLPPMERPRQVQYFQQQDLMIMVNQTPTKEVTHKQKQFQSAQMFIGFKQGRGGNHVVINDSKIKRAKKFFDSQEEEEQDFFSMPFGFNIDKHNSDDPSRSKGVQDFSMPCFKTVGSGLQVKISAEHQDKAKLLLSSYESFKKPTKVKKESKLVSQSLIKTANNQTSNNQKKSISMFLKPQSKDVKLSVKVNAELGQLARKSFNWDQYEKEYRDEIKLDKKQHSKSKSKTKRGTSKKKKITKESFRLTGHEFQFIKLCSLTLNKQQQKQRSTLLAFKVCNIFQQTFSHIKKQCQSFKCVLCSINYNKQSIDSEQIYSIMNKEFSKKWISFQQFLPLYEQVYFKLMKYQSFWPETVNKICTPSNIIVEISKKMLKIATQVTCSYLSHCITKDQVGRKINLIVKEKFMNKKMEIVYLKLSDGWSSVWSAIQSHNILYQFVSDDSKIWVGAKLSLCLWNIHPLNNILNFCPRALHNQKCIQFYYNGSIILKSNAKLGYTKQEFYRPLPKCRQRGGFIPSVQGFVIRMFVIKDKSKKNGQFSHHYAEILTPEGYTALIQFVLGEESSLVEFFRLFRCYNFYRLKINEFGRLTFGMDSSRFEQITKCKISQKDKIFPKMVQDVLTIRLLNNKGIEEIQQNQLYDVICQKGKLKLKGGIIEVQIQGEGIDMSGSCLYQQVQLASKETSCLKIIKNRYSSQSKRLHSIYQLII